MTIASLRSLCARFSLAAIAALSLAACGGGGSSAVPGVGGSGGGVPPTPTPPPVTSPIPQGVLGSWTDTAAGDNLYDPGSGLIVGTNGASRSLAMNTDNTYDYKYYVIQGGIFLYVHVQGSVTVNPSNQTLVLTYTNGTVMQPGNSFTPTGDITKPTTFSYATGINPVDGVTPQLTLTELTQNNGTYNYADNGSNGIMTFNACAAAQCPSPSH